MNDPDDRNLRSNDTALQDDPVATIDTPTPDMIDDDARPEVEQTVGTATPLAGSAGATTEALLEGDDEGGEGDDEFAGRGDEHTAAGFDFSELARSVAGATDGLVASAHTLIRERPLAVLLSAVAIGWLLGRPRQR